MAEKWQLVWAGKEVTNRQRSSLESLWMGDIIKATFWNLFTFIHFPWNPRATISIFFSVITQFLGTWYVHSDLFLLILFRKLAYLGPTAPLCSPFGYGFVLEDPYVRTAIFFGRTHDIMFGRTLFEYCVRKDTLHYVWKDTFKNMINKTFLTNSHLLTLKWSEYLRHVKRNP